MKRHAFIAGSTLATLAAAGSTASAQTTSTAPPPPALSASRSLTFQPHGAFYSRETATTPAIDPQVFVADLAAKAGPGPQSIDHIAGVRPLRLADPEMPLVNAESAPLLFTNSRWLAAAGNASLADAPGGGQEITVRFQRLIVFGVYSLFKNTFSSAGVVFAPLDGEGTKNSFQADALGNATLVITAPERLTARNGIVLVFHSDAADKGPQRGKLGWDAHHQLIAPLA